MKKILLVAAVAGLAFASCRKDRTCTCVTTGDYPNFSSKTTVTTQTKVKKNEALASCQSYTVKQTAPTADTYYSGEDCTLK